MGEVFFISYLVPQSIEEMIELLKSCTAEDMSPLKERLNFSEEDEEAGVHLSFKSFLDAIAYPIQCYPFTPEVKTALFKEIIRLYPRPASTSEALEDYLSLNKILMQIFKRIDPSQDIPVGLDALLPYPELPLEEKYHQVLFEKNVEAEGKVVIEPGFCKQATLPVEVRLELALSRFFSSERDQTDEALAVVYQGILNLLYFEALHVVKAWGSIEVSDVSRMHLQAYHTTIDQKVIRLSAGIETEALRDWDEGSETDFAFAIQRQALEEEIWRLAMSPKQVHKTTLVSRYQALNALAESSSSPRIHSFLAFVKQQMASIEYKDYFYGYAKMLRDYFNCEAIQDIVSRGGEDAIVLCHSILFNEFRHTGEMYKAARQEYSVSQVTSPQQRANKKLVCEAYATIVHHQQALYQHVYQKLTKLIGSKKEQIKWRKYYKFLIPNEMGMIVLPDALPEFLLPAFDSSIKMLAALARPALPASMVSVLPQRVVKPVIARKKPVSIKPKSSHIEWGDAISEEIESFIEDKENLNPSSTVSKTPPPPFIYAFRVLRWLRLNAAEDFPLCSRLFPEYVETTNAYQKLMLAYHAFTSSVDYFVKDLALQMLWNKDICYVLPAEVTMPEIAKTARGIITYNVSKTTGEVYHRFFSEKTSAEIVRKISQRAFNAADFPRLEDAGHAEEKIELPPPNPALALAEETIIHHPVLGTITIENQRTHIKWTLFRVAPEKITETMSHYDLGGGR